MIRCQDEFVISSKRWMREDFAGINSLNVLINLNQKLHPLIFLFFIIKIIVTGQIEVRGQTISLSDVRLMTLTAA